MPSRMGTWGLGVLLLALGAFGCGSQEGSPTPVAASIAGESDASASSADASAKTPAQRPESDPLHPVVEIETTHVTLTFEQDAERAPGTVRNFIK